MSLVAFYTYKDGKLEETDSSILKNIDNASAIYTRSRRMVIQPDNQGLTVEDRKAIVRGLRIILNGTVL